ncbi:hypothetical protein TNCV_1003861 [Trichonephila clavipes]|nr:hypothetical protein TNCV_1003861 [Trichonephila clavipes]
MFFRSGSQGHLGWTPLAYVIDRDVIDFSNDFQKHPCGTKSPKLVATNDTILAVLPVFRQVSIEAPL